MYFCFISRETVVCDTFKSLAIFLIDLSLLRAILIGFAQQRHQSKTKFIKLGADVKKIINIFTRRLTIT
jgi:hypothetical protein